MNTFQKVFKNMQDSITGGLPKGDSLKNHLYDGLNVDPNFMKAYGKQLDKYAKKYQDLGDDADVAKIGIDEFNESLIKSGQEAVKSTTFMQDVGNGLKSIGKTALSMVGNSVLDMAIGTGLQFVISGISDFIHREEIAIEKGRKAQSTISDTFNTFSSGKSTISNLGKSFSSSTDQINTTSDAIDSVAQRYTELSKGVDSKTNENVSLSSEDYQSYLDLSNQLAQLYPRLQSSTDSQGNAILNLGSNAKLASKSIQELYNAQMLSSNVKIGAELQDLIKGSSTQIKQYKEQIAEYKDTAENAKKQISELENFEQFKQKDPNFFELDSRDFTNPELFAEYYNDIVEAAKKAGINNFEQGGQVDVIDSKTGEHYQTSTFQIMDATAKQLETFQKNLEASNIDLANQFSIDKIEAEKQAKSTEILLKDTWKGMTDSLGQYLQTTDSFDKLDFGLQKALLDNMNNIDIKPLTEKYNGDAIRFMYGEFITPLSEMSSKSQKAISDLFNANEAELTVSEYADTVNKAFEEAFPNDTETQDKWKKAFGYSDILKENQDQLDKLKSNDAVKDYADQIDSLSNEDLEIAIDVIFNDGWKGNFDQLKQKIQDVKDATANEAMLSAVQKHVTDTQATFAAASSAVTESMSNTGLTSDSIKLIKEQVSSITEEFDELSNYDLNSLFTNSAKGVKLNNDRFEDLLQLQHQLKVADFAEQIGKQSDAVKTLTDDLSGLTEGTDEYNQKNTELINAQNQLSEMEQARSQYHAIYQQQQALFSEYAEWQRAQQTENAGDPYLNLLSGLEQAKEAYDQGLVGTDDFKTFAKIISPSGATDPINFAENYGTAAKYLTKDSSGITTFLQDLSTKTDAAGNAMASFNEQTGEWKMNIHSLGEVASALGTGETVVEAVLGRAEDYGATSYVISDMEDGILKTSEAIQKKAEAEVRLRQMQEANEKNPGTYNETAMQGAADEVEKYTQQINGLTESMQYMQEHPTENIVSDTAKQEIDELNKQRQQLLEEANGDTSSAAYKTAEELKNAIQSKADSANLELDAELNVTGVKQSAQEALKEIQGQEGSVISPEIDFNYDKSTMSLNQLDSKIQELNAEKVRIQAEADTPEAQAALEQLDAETQALQSQKIQVKIQTAIEEGNSIDELLAMSDADIITTVGCDASEVDAVRQKLLEMQGESITASVKIDQAQFTSLINAITGQPVEVPVEADTSNVASQVEQSTSGTSVKVDVEPKPIDPNAVASLQSSQTVNVTGNVTTLTAGVGLTPVAVTGNVVQLTGTPSTPIDVVGNITEVTGGEGKTIEIIGHIATVTGGNGKMINVIGNITSVTGGDATSGTINYEKGDVEKADGTVSTGIINYEKGDVEKADGTVSTGIINYDLGTVADAGSPVATGTINYKLGSVAKPGGATVTGTMASGTMLSSAQANGTAYNVLNMHPLTSANALGNVTVPRDQVSLTNEVGQESIVRNGVWSLLPGGAHLEHLKKGDIVFNASQTKALLEHGRMSGHARAYADGTLSTQTGNYYGLYKAYSAGGFTWRPSGGAAGHKLPSSSTKPNTNAQNANTNATRGNTTATNDNTKAAKKSTQVFDWVARRLEYFANKTKAIADTINDYISISQKKSLLQKQVYATNSEMHVNYRAARAYHQKAQSLGLSAKTKKLIEEGRYTLDDIDTSTESGKAHYDKVQKYMNYYDEYTKCIEAVRELRNEQVELFAQWAAIPTEEAEKKIDKLTQSYNGLAAIQARLETANMGGSAQALLMTQLDNTMRYANNNKKKTDAEFNKQHGRLSSIKAKEDKTKKAANTDKKSLNSAASALKKGASLTEAEKKRVNSGLSLSTKGLKGKKKTLVEKYNAALKKSNSSKKAYQNAVNYGKGVRKDYTAAKDAKHTNDVIYLEYKKNWEAAKKAYDKGDSLSYQNYLVDQELALLKQQNDAKNTAYRKANGNTHTATKRKDSYKSKVDSIKKKGKSYSKKYAKYLTAEQEKQLAAGKKINTSNIKNANVKKIIDQYNVDLQNAMNSYTAATQQLTAAQEAEAEAAANAAQSQAEYAQAQVEAEKTKFDNIKKYYEQRIEYQESWNKLYDKQREYDKIHGDYTTSESFDKPINEIDKAQRHQEEAVKKLQEQLNKAVKAGTIKEYSDEWLEMKSEIVDAQTAVQDYENQMEQLKQEQLTVKYEEMFDRAIEKAEKFKEKWETINSLITEEMMYDYDTGQLTEFGALSIVMNAKQLDTSLTTLKDYIKKRQQIMDDFKAEKFGQETYDKLMAENDSSLQNALKNAQSYQQAIIGIIKNQAKAEQDALFKVIDARKDALKKKKDYYDYDKTLKNKSKEIDLLKQQIAALDGVTDAQSKAEKARLEAELAEKQEDFDDTVKDHVYDLQVEGLDDLKDQLSEDFEKWSNELSANLEKMSQAIADAVKNVGNNTADAMLSIGKILEQFGIKAGDLGIDLSGTSTNTRSMDDNIVTLTRSGGRTIVTENGVSTPMSLYDDMIPKEITEKLINMSMADKIYPLADMKIPEIKVTGGGNVYTTNNAPLFNVEVKGDMTKDTLPDLQTILKESSKYTQNEMRKNLKRFG